LIGSAAKARPDPSIRDVAAVDIRKPRRLRYGVFVTGMSPVIFKVVTLRLIKRSRNKISASGFTGNACGSAQILTFQIAHLPKKECLPDLPDVSTP
jgi:hypothetical protein